MATASAVWAQPAPTVRVRGEITKVDGTTLSVKSRSGENLTVKLADPPRISAMVKSSLADIKEGSFIGVSAMPQPDGTQKAYAVHVFMDAQRGVVADRFSEWDNRPGSTMTNANVATTVKGKDGQLHRMPGLLGHWTQNRDFPPFAPKSFRQLWKERKQQVKGSGHSHEQP